MSMNHDDMAGELAEAWSEMYDAAAVILNAAEQIQSLAANSDLNAKLLVPLAEIFEACAFQDIVGQRLAKVSAALATGQLAEPVQEPRRSTEPPPAERADAHLLNGPQLGANALSQDAIDDLFGSLAAPV